MTIATRSVGTRVETRPETEEDPPPRAEPTFGSLCQNYSQLDYSEVSEDEVMLDLRLRVRGRSMCPVESVSQLNRSSHMDLGLHLHVDRRALESQGPP